MHIYKYTRAPVTQQHRERVIRSPTHADCIDINKYNSYY